MNFKNYLTEKNIKVSTSTDILAIKKLLSGKRIRILTQDGSHDYGPNGTIVKLGSNMVMGSESLDKGKEGGSGNNFRYSNFELLEGNTIADIEGRRAELIAIIDESKIEIEVLDMKKVHMQENGIEQLSENEWKIYEMLLTLKTTSRNDMQKAKAIAELLISA